MPILHLNGYKISNPTILARIPHEELDALLTGYGYHAHFVEGHEREPMHQAMARTVEACIGEIQAIQRHARRPATPRRPRWPMIVLRSPKGWTGPGLVDGHQVEGSWRAHQVPVLDPANKAHLKIVEAWLRSYEPEKLFDETGRLVPELRELAPLGDRRISANPHANGGLLRASLDLPAFADYAVEFKTPGQTYESPTQVLATFLRDVMKRNMTQFRVFSPDEASSNKLTGIYAASKKTWLAQTEPGDADGGRARRGRARHGKCSANTRSKGGWRAIRSRAATACSRPMKRSCM